MENKIEEISNNLENNNSKKGKNKNITLSVLSFLSIVISLTYVIYNILRANNQVNQPYLIINSCFILVLCILFAITGYIKKKNASSVMNKINIVSIMLYTIFQCSITSGLITLPTLKTVDDFTSTSINDVIKWANSNKITLEQRYEYSDLIESNLIISQSIPAGTLLKDVKKLEVIISNGPNYESISSIPSMVGWKIDDALKKIKEIKLNNVKIEFNFNSSADKNIIYEQSKSGEIRRNEELIIKVSLGKEEDLEPVELIDLYNMDEFDATLWLKRNGINYEIQYEFDNDIENKKVITTTPKKGTLIDQKETTVTLIISKGPKIVAPDLMTMSLDEITEWATKNKIVLSFDSEYNNEIKAGNIIRVNTKKGDILEEGSKIFIVTSRGKLKMISYTDGDITTLRTFASENNLTLSETEEFSDTVERGKFITISKNPGDIVNSSEPIKVIISLGKAVQVPSFIGMNVNNAKSTCSNLGLNCRFSYVYSSKTKGNIFNQSMTVGSNVIAGTDITLTVSNGVKPTNTTVTPTPTCTSYTLKLGAGSSVSQTQNMIKNLNPNGKFNFQSVNPGYGSTGSLRSDMLGTYQGTSHTSCETITIYIIDRSL